MLKVTLIIDNEIASPMRPEAFVKRYYLSDIAKKEMLFMKVEQESTFEEIEALKEPETTKSEYTQHICDYRCHSEDNGHHAWPSPPPRHKDKPCTCDACNRIRFNRITPYKKYTY